MKNNFNIRKTIGITALTLLVIGIIDYLTYYRLDNWALLFSFVFIMVYSVMLTIHITKRKHWAVQLLEWIVCAIVVMFCISRVFLMVLFMIWYDLVWLVYFILYSVYFFCKRYYLPYSRKIKAYFWYIILKINEIHIVAQSRPQQSASDHRVLDLQFYLHGNKKLSTFAIILLVSGLLVSELLLSSLLHIVPWILLSYSGKQ